MMIAIIDLFAWIACGLIGYRLSLGSTIYVWPEFSAGELIVFNVLFGPIAMGAAYVVYGNEFK